MTKRRLPAGYPMLLLLGLVWAPTVAGCGSSGGGGSSPGGGAKAIPGLVGGKKEARTDGRKGGGLFAKGGLPTAGRFKKYGGYSYYLVDKPRVSGTTTNVRVSVVNETTTKEAGKVEWSFVKEGESWKIKSAPLP